MNSAIIFDTNAYRILTYGKPIQQCNEEIEIIKDKELAVGNQSFLSPVVLIELGAHLADVNDKAYENCLASYITCYNHCKERESDNFRLLADGDSQLAKYLFNYTNTRVLDKWTAYGQFAYRMSKDSSDTAVDGYRRYFMEMRAYVDMIEMQFIADINQHIVNEIQQLKESGNADDAKQRQKQMSKELKTTTPLDYFALAQVVKAADIAGANLDQYDIFDLTEAVKKIFPAPLYLYRNIISKLIDPKFKLQSKKKKRWNWIWDLQILFAISSATMAAKKTLLISGDKDVTRAAKDSDLAGMIVKLPDYLDSIGFKQ